MNRMERLKEARNIAARFVSLVDQDEQDAGTWIETVGRLGAELHDATKFFMPTGTARAQGMLVEVGQPEDGPAPLATFQLLTRDDAVALGPTLYEHVVIELRKDPAFR